MASRKAAICVLSVAFLVQIARAVDYSVGGTTGGWDTNTDLSTWAAGQTFLPGDSVTFKYPSFHDVVEVTKADYDTCSGSNPLGTYTGGSTTIKLTKPGELYFICSTPGHCAAGMKLEVDVQSTASALPPKNSQPEKNVLAPSPAPETAPTAITDSTESELPVVSTPASPPLPASGAGESARWTYQIASGLALGMLVVLTV